MFKKLGFFHIDFALNFPRSKLPTFLVNYRDDIWICYKFVPDISISVCQGTCCGLMRANYSSGKWAKTLISDQWRSSSISQFTNEEQEKSDKFWKVCDQGVTIYINSFAYNECYNLNFWRYICTKRLPSTIGELALMELNMFVRTRKRVTKSPDEGESSKI